jgi:hypothetical protein
MRCSAVRDKKNVKTLIVERTNSYTIYNVREWRKTLHFLGAHLLTKMTVRHLTSPVVRPCARSQKKPGRRRKHHMLCVPFCVSLDFRGRMRVEEAVEDDKKVQKNEFHSD